MKWPEVRLGDAATMDLRQVDPKSLRPETPYVGLEDLNGDGQIGEVRSVEQAGVRSTKFSFSTEHVLYGKLRPYLRKIARPVFAGVCSTDIVPIRPLTTLDRNYLFHYLRRPEVVSVATARSKGASLPRISPKALADLAIPLPPLPEQRRIAALLDRADDIRRKREGAVRQLDQLVQSTFLEMFGDPLTDVTDFPTVHLEDVADIVSGLTKGRRLPEGSRVESVPYLRVANVQDGHIDLDDVRLIDATEAEVDRYVLQAGDVLLTEGGDADKLGRGAVWAGSIPRCIHQNHVFRVRLKDPRLTSEYLSAHIGSRYGKDYFLRAAKQTTGIASINRSQLGRFPVVVPPKELQAAFETTLRAVRAARTAADAATLECHNLVASLSSAAFAAR